MTWIGSLPSWALFPLFAAAAFLFTVAVDGIMRRRVVPVSLREHAGPTAATTLQALATIYAVLVAFVIVDEYGQLRNAQGQVSTKAAQLSIIFENSRNLPEADGTAIRHAVLDYARLDVRVGLPSLAHTSKPNKVIDASLENVYRVVSRIEPATESDRAAYQEILTALSQVSQTRSNLVNSTSATIPTSLFVILVVLAGAVLAVATLMDTRHRRSHLLIIGALVVGVSITLALAAALDYPFRGFIHINTNPLTQFVTTRAAR
jgi:Protein of unknown function (DUF4239)